MNFADLLQKLPKVLESPLATIRFNTYLRGLIRVLTPFFFGIISSDLFQHFVTDLSTGEKEGFIGVALSVYYLIARRAEAASPRAGFLMLGAKGSPSYDVENNQAEILAIGAEEELNMLDVNDREPAVPFS